VSTPAPPTLSLEEARALRAAGDWRTLVTRGDGTAESELLAEPEVGLHYGVALRRVSQIPRAMELAQKLEAEVRRRGDSRLLVEVVMLVGALHWDAGHVTDAEARYSEVLDLGAARENDEAVANASNNLGVLANIQGRRDLALTCYQRALASYQRQGNSRGLAQTHHNLGISYRDLSFEREADSHFQRAVEYAELSGTPDVVAMAELERAMLRARSGDPLLATEMARRARDRFEKIGSPVGIADAERVLALAERAGGRDENALPHLELALETALSADDAVLRAEVQRDRGLLLRDLGRMDQAREALLDSINSFTQLGAAAEAEALRVILNTF
jgi:tetratricopeptide (TPR) repeat protein